MNSENQDEELEVLRSIYEGDGSFRELNHKSFQYKYGIEGEPHSFVLEISWPESYPESLPDINLDAFYNKHMKTHVKDNIKSKVLKEADANVGSAMTYTLIEWVKENLEELLIDQPSNLDTSISVANLDIEEKVEHLCKDNKERRTGLTKAQKRRQWDRMDGKGEKIRGYDWVDKKLDLGSGVSPDKTELRQDLETTPTGVDFTPTRRELTSTRLDFTPKTRFSPESTAMQQVSSLIFVYLVSCLSTRASALPKTFLNVF
uniref:RWD domain-containing protein n=1 Tax=Daphnia galeata TaxID=27404 RepID=A0A8J2RN54_9CRUS|nr:unnamed protein product [Daphnia galeata]